jgi:TatD DNase family protein
VAADTCEWQAQTYTDEVERELVEAMALPKTLAWGEIGLDYHYNLSDPATQRQVFARQIQLAVQHNKPLVIHTREAEEGKSRVSSLVVSCRWSCRVVSCVSCEVLMEWRQTP